MGNDASWDSNNCSLTVGVEEVKKGINDLIVYPNPSAGIFTVHSEETIIKQIDITNLFGEEIFTTTVANSETTIDLSKQAKGIYFIQVLTEKGIINKKIIKQ